MDTTKYRTQIPVKKDGIFAYEIYLEKDFGMLAERLKVCKPEGYVLLPILPWINITEIR